MMEWVYISLYLASWVIAFLLFCDAWRQDFDMSYGDVLFMAFLSLFVPVSVFAASLIWIITWLDNRPYKDSKVVWRKK